MEFNISRWLSVVAIGVSLSSMLATPTAKADDDPFHVQVSGGGSDAQAKKRLKRFYAKLQAEVAPLTLSEAFIECQNCSDLDTAAAVVTQLNIWLQGDKVGPALGRIGAAYGKTYARNPSPAFSLTVNDVAPPDPACPYPGPLCKSRPFCASMAGCSENAFPLACKVCDGNAGTLAESCGAASGKDQK